MPVEFRCPGCDQRLTADAGDLSSEVKCARCQRSFRPLDVVKRDEPLPAIVTPRPAEASAFARVKEAAAEEAAAEEAAVEASAAEAPAAEQTRGGTIVLDGQQAPTPSPARAPRGALEAIGLTPARLDELRGFAADVVADLGDRIPARLGRVVTIAAPVLVLLLFVVLMLVDSPAARWIVGILATLSLTAVLGLVGLVLVSQRRVSRHGDPGAPRGLAGVSTVARIWLFASGAGLLALASGVSLLFAGSGGGDAESTVAAVASSSATSSATAAPSATQAPEVAELDRKDEVFAGGLVLHLPASFEPSDQGYDVLIHFSGNTKVVEESVGAAKMNVALVVANLGQGSGPYMERFGAPASFSKLIEQLDARMAKRGVKVAKTRRVALSSFGAGYGALLQILSSAPNVERIDALLVMEGLYAGYSDKKKKIVDRQRIEPYVRFAKLAKDGSKLFVITHSELQADEYAGTKIVSDAILAELKGERKPADPAKDSPAKVELAAAASLFGKAPAVSLEAKSAAHIGGFHVLGYGGDTAQHHIAHLAQMSTTVLPLLSERWK